MKDIGYYAGFLSTAAQKEITEAPIGALIDLLQGVAERLYSSAMLDPDFDYYPLENMGYEDASDRDKIALIRGLCDRIELKLMEQAK